MMAMIREESSFDPYAVSRTQAKGLMQLMPKTGKEVSFRLGIRWVGEDSLYDPELNIRLGIFYFAWLRKQIKGPAYFSVAAYNAGPDVSYQWTKRPGAATSMEQFVLSIPYPETQGYVRRVMNSYMIYRMLYAD
jgi:soluble lytic murein transglycosylase